MEKVELPLPTLDLLHAEATPGDWMIYVEHCSDREHAKRECERLVDGTKGDSVDFYMLTTEEGVAPGVTGCGPTSKANAEWITQIHNTWPTISARLKEQDESIAELKADRRALVHEIRRYASYMLQLTEEFAKDDIERYQRAMDRAHEMQRKSDDAARANPEEFEANVEQVAKATRELRK